MRKVLLAVLFALVLLFMQACANDGSAVYDGDNPKAIEKLQACMNTDGTPIMHSSGGDLFVYCLHKQGR